MKVERLNRRLQSWIHPTAKFMNRISMGVLFLMMLLTITDVLLRKLFNNSILGTVEMTEFMMLAVVFLGFAHTEALNGNIKVDLFISRLDRRKQGLVDMITQFICFLLCSLLACASLVYSAQMRESGEVSQDLWLPIYPFTYIVAMGFGVFAFVLLMKFFAAVLETREK